MRQNRCIIITALSKCDLAYGVVAVLLVIPMNTHPGLAQAGKGFSLMSSMLTGGCVLGITQSSMNDATEPIKEQTGCVNRALFASELFEGFFSGKRYLSCRCLSTSFAVKTAKPLKLAVSQFWQARIVKSCHRN